MSALYTHIVTIKIQQGVPNVKYKKTQMSDWQKHNLTSVGLLTPPTCGICTLPALKVCPTLIQSPWYTAKY